jgi:hypothetical protein
MMASVAAGSRLLVQGARVPLVLRSLRGVDLEGGWTVPVMGDVAALRDAAGLGSGTILVEFPTEHGPVRLDAELVQSDDALLLRAPKLRTAAMVEQRRENVRGVVQLPVRGSVLGTGATPSRAQAAARSADDGMNVDLEGVTHTVSGGGISADLTAAGGFAPGTRIYVEIGLPGGELAPAVMAVLEHDGPRVRASFVDISPMDRERLVRLVFTRQRADLAERRRSADGR